MAKFKPDYARTESAEVARRIDYDLEAVYREQGLEVIRVPWMNAGERAKMILDML